MQNSTDFDFVVNEWDQRDYDNMPIRWRKSCTRMAAAALGVDIQTFSDMIDWDDNVAFFRLQYEIIALRRAMNWWIFSILDDLNNIDISATPVYNECPPTVERAHNNIMNLWD